MNVKSYFYGGGRISSCIELYSPLQYLEKRGEEKRGRPHRKLLKDFYSGDEDTSSNSGISIGE